MTSATITVTFKTAEGETLGSAKLKRRVLNRGNVMDKSPLRLANQASAKIFGRKAVFLMDRVISWSVTHGRIDGKVYVIPDYAPNAKMLARVHVTLTKEVKE